MKSVSNKDYNIEYKQKQYKHLNIKFAIKGTELLFNLQTAVNNWKNKSNGFDILL